MNDVNQRLNIIESLIQNRGNLLDIGCATGIFLKKAGERGRELNGIEKSENAANIASELIGPDRISTEDLIHYKTNNKFHLITLWALIEHLTEPRAYLSKINNILELGGVLTLSTPNMNSVSRVLMGRKWRYYLPPEHLLYFNVNSLSILLNEFGFKVLKLKSHIKQIAFFQKDSFFVNYYNRNFTFRIILKSLLFPLYFINRIIPIGETLEVYAQKVKDVENDIIETH